MDSQKNGHGWMKATITMLTTICAMMAWAPPIAGNAVTNLALLKESRAIRRDQILSKERPAMLIQKGTKTNLVGLTFDDGPHPEFTPRILATLKQNKATATFFLIGAKVLAEPDVARDVMKAGNEIANHSYMHTNLTKVNAERLQREWSYTSDIIEEVLGISPNLCRPPGGNYNQAVLDAATEQGMTTVLWTANSSDFLKDSSKDIATAVLRQIKPGGIILLHDTVDGTVEALPIILKELKKRGLRAVSISELMAAKR